MKERKKSFIDSWDNGSVQKPTGNCAETSESSRDRAACILIHNSASLTALQRVSEERYNVSKKEKIVIFDDP
jgi:hypothetical protein